MYGVGDAGRAARSRARVASPASLIWALKMIQAPIFASAPAATSPIPDVPPVITTVFPYDALVSTFRLHQVLVGA
jgi:hypothetical protein